MVHDGLAWMVCVSLPETDDCCSCYADKLYSAGVTILAIPSLDFMAAAQGQFPVKDTQSIKPARHITVDIVSSDIIKPKGPTSNYVVSWKLACVPAILTMNLSSFVRATELSYPSTNSNYVIY